MPLVQTDLFDGTETAVLGRSEHTAHKVQATLASRAVESVGRFDGKREALVGWGLDRATVLTAQYSLAL